MSSLLANLPYSEYKKVKFFNLGLCERIAQKANLDIVFNRAENAGEQLLKALDRGGYSRHHYDELIGWIKPHKPQAKVAILIGNDKYIHLSKLATPSTDCDSLATNLKSLGFIVITMKNTLGYELRIILSKLSELLPEDSYCFVYYGGHGCQIGNIKCMLSVDCPQENIELKHCVTENYLLKMFEKCKLDLCVLIMDMCRVTLDRQKNPQIYNAILDMEEYEIPNNLYIGYSAQSSQSAYEWLQIECSASLDSNVTYELKTGDTSRILPGASQYADALCTRIRQHWDVSAFIDKVHEDLENALRRQRPIKVQCGTESRNLFESSIGNGDELLQKVKTAVQMYDEYCTVEALL